MYNIEVILLNICCVVTGNYSVIYLPKNYDIANRKYLEFSVNNKTTHYYEIMQFIGNIYININIVKKNNKTHFFKYKILDQIFNNYNIVEYYKCNDICNNNTIKIHENNMCNAIKFTSHNKHSNYKGYINNNDLYDKNTIFMCKNMLKNNVFDKNNRNIYFNSNGNLKIKFNTELHD